MGAPYGRAARVAKGGTERRRQGRLASIQKADGENVGQGAGGTASPSVST
jgi:hypothetical protein